MIKKIYLKLSIRHKMCIQQIEYLSMFNIKYIFFKLHSEFRVFWLLRNLLTSLSHL